MTKSGYVAIVGRPNVGKSTLLNHLIGKKVSITARKPQTTRHRLLGIKTQANAQIIYVDTPGLHLGEGRAMNRAMNKAAKSALSDVDLIVFVVDVTRWTEEDDYVCSLLATARVPVILVMNKIDLLADKSALLPMIEQMQAKVAPLEIVPLSAKTQDNLDALETLILKQLPEGPFYFDKTDVTDRSNRFLISEIIREKLFRLTGDELPYATTVQIESVEATQKLTKIAALILVEREGQKRIVIGRGGEKLKEIGSAARVDIEKLLETKVFLQLWVKVRSGWADDERALKSLGYDDA